jgi:hypothetical protein
MPATAQHMAAYIACLRHPEWSEEDRAALTESQVLIDPDFQTWNRYAPEQYRTGITDVVPDYDQLQAEAFEPSTTGDRAC